MPNGTRHGARRRWQPALPRVISQVCCHVDFIWRTAVQEVPSSLWSAPIVRPAFALPAPHALVLLVARNTTASLFLYVVVYSLATLVTDQVSVCTIGFPGLHVYADRPGNRAHINSSVISSSRLVVVSLCSTQVSACTIGFPGQHVYADRPGNQSLLFMFSLSEGKA
ncbi:hypothetical protein SCLCIDRAFT_862317 [Scleroderma citrinum Foug A]|uniref:Uncharacterized protein n=1 Tax=Scleroderma citrinum Foug A TaxID=1036808 RepID=A0A0C3DLY7_9AGAM|nr:hypothetical protein SCLCIDRAFT_862317 [Scleroderma citrinum Foug A]